MNDPDGSIEAWVQPRIPQISSKAIFLVNLVCKKKREGIYFFILTTLVERKPQHQDEEVDGVAYISFPKSGPYYVINLSIYQSKMVDRILGLV